MRINKQIAYFIGVLHSDGCIYRFNDKKRNRVQMRLNLTIGKKSIPMAKKFQEILFNQFNRTVNIRKTPKRESYVIQTSINKLKHNFNKWNKQQIPKKIRDNKDLFGAYLAGMIDGDGHLKLKNNKDRILNQLVIRICYPNKLENIKRIMEKYTLCKVHFVNYKNKNCFDTCFYVTYKNLKFLEDSVFPHITLTYKKRRFMKYAKKIKRACRDSKFSAARNFLQQPQSTGIVGENPPKPDA